MTTITKEVLQNIIETDHVQCGEASAMARMLLAGMEQEPVYSDERDAFEAIFPIPKYAERCGTGYCVTEYSAWAANDFVKKWEGWSACRAAMLNEPRTRVQSAKIPVKGISDES